MASINDVKDNKEKSLTYRKVYRLHQAAIKNEFYYESLLIDYAILEDRFESFLSHLGLVSYGKDKINIKKTYKEEMNKLFNKNRERHENISFSKIFHKYDFIKRLLNEYSKNQLVYYPSLKFVGRKLDRIDMHLLIELIDKIDIWVKSRNKIVHGLMKRNYMDVENSISELAEEGFVYFRELDSYVSKVRRK